MCIRHACYSLAIFAGMLASAARADIDVLPGGSVVEGKSIGEWTAEWWKWALGIPMPHDPLSDTTGASANGGQSGPVFFIAGTLPGAPSVTRTFDVPPDKYLLFPTLNWVGYGGADPGYASTKEEITAITTGTINPAGLVATIDGVPVADLASHRESSPGDAFSIPVVADNSFGHPAATYTDAYADGYWIMLAPLGTGMHTLHFGGTSVPFNGAGGLQLDSFTVDVTAQINAIPEPSAAILTTVAALSGLLLAVFKSRGARRLCRK